MAKISKLDIAIEQLEDALRSYFARRYHSAIVLAGAAEQLLAAYVMRHQVTPAWLEERRIITKIANGLRARDEGGDDEKTTEQDIGDLLNHAYNHSKHAGKKDHLISFNPRFESNAIIDRAISNFDALFSRSEYNLTDLPLAQEFRMESSDEVTLEDIDGEIDTSPKESR